MGVDGLVYQNVGATQHGPEHGDFENAHVERR